MKETSGFDYPAEVPVCDSHATELRGGAEFLFNQTKNTLFVGVGAQQSGKVYLQGMEGISVSAAELSNRPDDEGMVLNLKVRRAGSNDVEILPLEASPHAISELREWLNQPYMK
ncbi:hypothetical protein [Rhodococcus sp. RS1C4]|nr:hypothetical protein [Rhodococcus sp. RS1C4]